MSEVVPTQIRGRYAPSPSGDLHMGNLRTALLAWLFAKSAGGQFVLRVEDLDRPRVRSGATEQMLEDLRWLGLYWDEGPDCSGPHAPYTQSERLDIYQHYLAQLQDQGYIYPCYCSRAEIAQVASAPQQGSDEGPRYPGTCRHLSATQRRHREASGRRPSWRFHVDDERIVTFTDLLQGTTTQQVQQTIGDFIVKRSDGIFAYQFAVVVDDALMHINEVVRGADLLSSTPRQILLFEALGFPVPTFAHVPLVLDEQGKRLAKRQQSAGLSPLREQGATPEQVIGHLAASCGLVEDDSAISPHALAQSIAGHTHVIMHAKLQNKIHSAENAER